MPTTGAPQLEIYQASVVGYTWYIHSGSTRVPIYPIRFGTRVPTYPSMAKTIRFGTRVLQIPKRKGAGPCLGMIGGGGTHLLLAFVI